MAVATESCTVDFAVSRQGKHGPCRAETSAIIVGYFDGGDEGVMAVEVPAIAR